MNTGAFPKSDYERVTKSMFENQRRDTAPSLRTIVGQDLKVLNLRPLNKSLHLDDPQFRTCALRDSIERIQLQNLKQTLNSLQNDEIGLPPLNSNQMRYFRTLKRIKIQNNRQNQELAKTK